MLPKLISKSAGPLTLSESSDMDGLFPDDPVYREAIWNQGSIRLQCDFPEKKTGILCIQPDIKEDDRIELITRSVPFSLIFLFGENCRLTIRHNSLILHDRGGACFCGVHDRYLCDFPKSSSCLFILIQYSASFLEKEFFNLKATPGFFYPRPVICTRDTLDDLSTLIFSAHTEMMKKFIREEILRSLFLRFTDPYQARLFQPAASSLSEYTDFYHLRSQLLKQMTRILDYPNLMAAAGIHDTYRFRKTCKQLYGLKSTGYITEARMARAASLLKNPALSIKEIALSCGYPGTQYFDRVFLHYFGITPKAFRQG